MANAPPYYTRRQHLAVKIEATEGTDSVPTDTDVIHPVFGTPEWTPALEQNERDVVGNSFSRINQIQGERSAVITFSTEIKGSGTAGTAPPNLSAALLACNMSETIVASTSVTYAPVSAHSANDSVTVEIREGDTGSEVKIKKITGARGTFTIEGTKGGILMINFTFTGKYVAPSEGVNQFTTPDPGPNPLPFQGVSYSLHGVSGLRIQALTFDMANNVVLENDVNDATGNRAAQITGRQPVGTVDPEQTDISTMDFFDKITTNAVGVQSFNLTGSAGNITTFSMPSVQILNVGEGDRDGLRTESLDYQANRDPAFDTGDDEITIVFT